MSRILAFLRHPFGFLLAQPKLLGPSIREMGAVRIAYRVRGEVETRYFYALKHRNEERNSLYIVGNDEDMMASPQAGALHFDDSDKVVLDLVSLSSLKTDDMLLEAQRYRDYIEEMREKVMYDEQLLIYTAPDGTPFYISHGCNCNKYGFTAWRPYPSVQDNAGEAAAFIDWTLLPFYTGTLHLDKKPEPKRYFKYCDWMGNKVRSRHVLATRDKERQSDLKYRIKRFHENREALDRDLREILNLIGQQGH